MYMYTEATAGQITREILHTLQWLMVSAIPSRSCTSGMLLVYLATALNIISQHCTGVPTLHVFMYLCSLIARKLTQESRRNSCARYVYTTFQNRLSDYLRSCARRKIKYYLVENSIICVDFSALAAYNIIAIFVTMVLFPREVTYIPDHGSTYVYFTSNRYMYKCVSVCSLL